MFNVLLVDDEELALTSLRYALPWKEFGFTDILTTTSSLEALALLKKDRIDACFIDIRMPGMSGLELLKAAQQCALETLFIVVSGYSDFSYAREAIKFGVLDYCLKPVIAEDCVPVLEKLSMRLFSIRISKDPLYISRLLTDPDFCNEFLFRLTGTDCKALTLLLIHSQGLKPLLKRADLLLPARTLFPGKNEAALIWKDSPDKDSLASFFQDYRQSALFVYDVIAPVTAASFQSSFKRLRILCYEKNTGQTGVVRVPAVNEETAAYFFGILAYMEENYDRRLTLTDLAHQFGINYSYLSQLFKKTTDMSFAEHLTNIRLKHACELLSSTYRSVTDIAETVGFNDYHYFCNIFKRVYSMTPSQYRNASGKETKV